MAPDPFGAESGPTAEPANQGATWGAVDQGPIGMRAADDYIQSIDASYARPVLQPLLPVEPRARAVDASLGYEPVQLIRAAYGSRAPRAVPNEESDGAAGDVGES
jgi:hypothetical protein